MSANETESQKKRTISRTTAAKAEKSLPKPLSCKDEPVLDVTVTVTLALVVTVGVLMLLTKFGVVVVAVVSGVAAGEFITPAFSVQKPTSAEIIE
jgi:hypothetical protein